VPFTIVVGEGRSGKATRGVVLGQFRVLSPLLAALYGRRARSPRPVRPVRAVVAHFDSVSLKAGIRSINKSNSSPVSAVVKKEGFEAGPNRMAAYPPRSELELGVVQIVFADRAAGRARAVVERLHERDQPVSLQWKYQVSQRGSLKLGSQKRSLVV